MKFWEVNEMTVINYMTEELHCNIKTNPETCCNIAVGCKLPCLCMHFMLVLLAAHNFLRISTLSKLFPVSLFFKTYRTAVTFMLRPYMYWPTV